MWRRLFHWVLHFLRYVFREKGGRRMVIFEEKSCYQGILMTSGRKFKGVISLECADCVCR